MFIRRSAAIVFVGWSASIVLVGWSAAFFRWTRGLILVVRAIGLIIRISHSRPFAVVIID